VVRSQAFTTCLNAAPAGDILVPAGVYKINHTIVKNGNQNLIGAGSRAPELLCEVTNGPCLVVGDTTSGATKYTPSRVQNMTVQGPGPSSSSIGVYLGGDPQGQFSASDAYGDGADLVNGRVTGFNHGIEWGNNAWGNKLTRTFVFGIATGLYVTAGLSNSGENMRLTDTILFNNEGFWAGRSRKCRPSMWKIRTWNKTEHR